MIKTVTETFTEGFASETLAKHTESGVWMVSVAITTNIFPAPAAGVEVTIMIDDQVKGKFEYFRTDDTATSITLCDIRFNEKHVPYDIYTFEIWTTDRLITATYRRRESGTDTQVLLGIFDQVGTMTKGVCDQAEFVYGFDMYQMPTIIKRPSLEHLDPAIMLKDGRLDFKGIGELCKKMKGNTPV